ncbi:isoprenoid biosynthesis glyoxalase ElbB [Anaplasma bovis]|uniref:isoprenoid biosynthesis glyoxalase ElbB n=1 Tax=Anaplasma bovis TaxID=186733 RepID=UPI002FEEF8D0
MNCVVLLCGCGHRDGSEIRESVIALIELERLGIDYLCCAPNVSSSEVIDHVSGTVSASETGRNLLVESARIARGNIKDILSIDPQRFDMLLFPGGLGVAKFSSNILDSAGPVSIRKEISDIILGFHSQKKAIGAICISPAVVSAALNGVAKVSVTLGDESNGNIISRCGGLHVPCDTDNYVVDKENAVFSCPAYMRDDKLHKIQLGVQKMVGAMYDYTKSRSAS